MGVNYINLPDIVDYLVSISGKKVNEFDGALELWVTPEIKIKSNTALKIEYSYTTKQYNVEETSTGIPLNYIFTYQLHSPTLVLNHLFFQEHEVYIIKIGVGLGFTRGYFIQSFPVSGKKIIYQTNGGILKFESIFSSRLDGKVYVHLSAEAKIGLSTEASDNAGNKLIIRKPFREDRNMRLNFIGIAIRAGFSYYF